MAFCGIGCFMSTYNMLPNSLPELLLNLFFLGIGFWAFYLYGKMANKTFNLNNEIKTVSDITTALPVVEWENIGKDDFTFRFADYCLRVEQMDKRHWWWCVYFKDGYAGFDEPRAKTELEAKLLAELCFVRHLVSSGLKLEKSKIQNG
jgi:hypothetical protein